MKAWTFTARGQPPKVLTLRDDLPVPNPASLKPDEVIIKISHVALDSAVSRLMAAVPHFTSAPWIPELKFSGTITAVGGGGGSGSGNDDIAAAAAAAVTTTTTTRPSLKVGDAVFGMVPPRQVSRYGGALVEYIVLPRDAVALNPEGLKFAEVAELSGAVTIIGMAERARLLEVVVEGQGQRGNGGERPVIRSLAVGKRILVTGGGTSLGSSMIQFARYLVGSTGEVVSTASERSMEMVKSLGADTVVDYKRQPKLHKVFEREYGSTTAGGKQFDAIIDIAGSDPLLYPRSPAYLKPEGSFVFAGSINTTLAEPGEGIAGSLLWMANMLSMVLSWTVHGLRPVVLGGVPRRSFFYSGKPTVQYMELARQLAEGGHLKFAVDSVWDMDDGLKAYEHLISGKAQGKVLIQVAK